MGSLHTNVRIKKETGETLRVERAIIRDDGAVVFDVAETDVKHWRGTHAVKILHTSEVRSVLISNTELEDFVSGD